MHYQITPKNLGGHEWIGLHCRVLRSNDQNKQKIAGLIVDETKNTIKVETSAGEKTIPKKEAVLSVLLQTGWTELNLSNWCYAPESRVKAFLKKK